MFHPYVPGSNSPFGPSPSGSPSRSTPPVFCAPLNPRRPRDADDSDSDSDSDRHSFDSSDGSVYCARPAKSPTGSERSSFDNSGKGKEVDYGAEVAPDEAQRPKSLSRKGSQPGGWYSSEEEDEADSDDGYYHRRRRRHQSGGVYDYYEYASPTEPLFPPTPPAGADFPYAHTATPPLSTSPLVSSLFPTDHQPGGSSFFNRPIFRPPTSMNRSYGSINAHPFHRAPMAERSFREREGEETPDELEGDQEGGWGGYWGSGPGGRRGSERRGNGGGVWQGVLRGCCLVCCCVKVDEMGD